MDILLEGRRLSRSRIYGYGRRGVATLDWSQARNFSIPLSLTLGLSLKKEGTEGGAVRTGPAAAAAAAAGRACVNFTIVFRMRRRHLWMRQRLQRQRRKKESVGRKRRIRKISERIINRSIHPSMGGGRERDTDTVTDLFFSSAETRCRWTDGDKRFSGLVVSVLMKGLSYVARNVLSYTRFMMQRFLSLRDSPIIPLRRLPWSAHTIQT